MGERQRKAESHAAPYCFGTERQGFPGPGALFVSTDKTKFDHNDTPVSRRRKPFIVCILNDNDTESQYHFGEDR